MKKAILAAIFTLLISEVRGHGLMTEPPQRGILSGTKFAPNMRNPVNGAPRDVYAHFPAGDRNVRPGAGKLSQERQAKFNWTPFEPMKKGFQWRASVCGDLKSGPQEHLRGGKYYFNGYISRTFRQGGIVRVGTAIIAHHNGYMEMHVCDVKQCRGEISEDCFQKGYCRQLKRARYRECDSGLSKNCAPIDRNYPGRWYLPCTRNPSRGFDIFSEDYARFVLPHDLTCEHCVLHWFWTSANNCNPPGVLEYFEGPDAPKTWGKCVGQAGALGGYTRVQRPCGGREFPEEYYQCADIRIAGDAARSGRNRSRPSTSKREPESSPSPSPETNKNKNKKWYKRKPSPTTSSSASPSISSSPSVSPSPRPVKKKNTKRKKNKKRQKWAPSPSASPSTSAYPSVSPTPSTSAVSGDATKDKEVGKTADAKNPFESVKLVVDGHVIKKLLSTNKYKFKNLKSKQLTFKVTTYRQLPRIDFYIDGKKLWTEYTPPYYMFGNSGDKAHYWPSPIFGRRFTLELRAEGYSYKVYVKFVNK